MSLTMDEEDFREHLYQAYREGRMRFGDTNPDGLDLDRFRSSAEWANCYRPMLRRMAGFRDDGYGGRSFQEPPDDGFARGQNRLKALKRAFGMGARDGTEGESRGRSEVLSEFNV